MSLLFLQGASDDTVDYENYRHVCHKWHYKMAKALVVCLESKDYVQVRSFLRDIFLFCLRVIKVTLHTQSYQICDLIGFFHLFQIRNALTVLTKILPHFPVIANLAGVIEKRIEKVIKTSTQSFTMNGSSTIDVKHLIFRSEYFLNFADQKTLKL